MASCLSVIDPDDKTQIDCDQLDHMVDAFLDARFTYFDTAYPYYPYHGGWSERAVKRCLVERHELMQRVTEVLDAA